ncbi:unnamed protein product, partial [Urochloa humidicola]
RCPLPSVVLARAAGPLSVGLFLEELVLPASSSASVVLAECRLSRMRLRDSAALVALVLAVTSSLAVGYDYDPLDLNGNIT